MGWQKYKPSRSGAKKAAKAKKAKDTRLGKKARVRTVNGVKGW